MSRPLYRGIRQLESFPQGGHAGLWYDRFFDKYNENWQVPKDEDGKLTWIKTITGQPVGGSEVKVHAERQKRLVSAIGGKTFPAKTGWHFVTGLGNNHPVENGFAWHPTLGVPYLTGAAVKGLLRCWCEAWSETFVKHGEDKANKLNKLRKWFGPSLGELNPKKGSGIPKQKPAAGELIFFDALPTAPVILKADVMTPHMGDWYEKGGEAPAADGSNVPADWHSPVPVPFLVVAPQQKFQFSVAKRPRSAIDLHEVVSELKNALASLGAGAKTAVGYGIMHALSAEETAQKEAADLIAARRCEWVDMTITTLKNENNSKEDEVLRDKKLAEAWRKISDSKLKERALQDIKTRWEARGWWQSPPGKAARQAKQIYEGKA